MSAARDVRIALEEHEREIGAIGGRLAEHDDKIGELQRAHATIDRAQQTFESQIEIFRDAINEQFRALREELRRGRNGS